MDWLCLTKVIRIDKVDSGNPGRRICLIALRQTGGCRGTLLTIALRPLLFEKTRDERRVSRDASTLCPPDEVVGIPPPKWAACPALFGGRASCFAPCALCPSWLLRAHIRFESSERFQTCPADLEFYYPHLGCQAYWLTMK